MIQAQISLKNQKAICFGKLAHFDYKPPTGKKVKSTFWDFGDGFTASRYDPIHLYKEIGTYKVVLKIQFDDGSSKTEQKDFIVRKLPKAVLKLSDKSELCFNKNNVCITDMSTPAAIDQPLKQKNVIWGDGTTTQHGYGPYSNEICHKFPATSTYVMTLETIDTFGCSSKAVVEVKIKSSPVARIGSKVDMVDCGSKGEVLIYHKSTYNGYGTVVYKWDVDGEVYNQGHSYNNPIKKILTSSKTIKAQLTVTAPNGCRDETTRDIAVTISDFNQNRNIQVSPKTLCYKGGKVQANFQIDPDENVAWYLDGKQVSSSRTKYVIDVEKQELALGKHELAISIEKNGCKIFKKDSFTVHGPIVNMSIVNQVQCFGNRRVFMVNTSESIDSSQQRFLWRVKDPYGEDCIVHRASGVNKYKNCNTTMGWFAKHDFSKPGSYRVDFEVRDDRTGCHDQIYDYVQIGGCGRCNFDSINPLVICEGKRLFEHAGKNDPIMYSVDTGKTWRPLLSPLSSTLPGVHDMMFVFKFDLPLEVEDYGDDSIRIYGGGELFDTIRIRKYLHVLPQKKDSFTFKFHDYCTSHKADIKLQKGTFYKGDRIIINWGDGEITRRTYGDTAVDKFFTHTYDEEELDTFIRITLITADGCENEYLKPVRYGFNSNIYVSGRRCLGDSVYISARIFNTATGTYWTSTNKLGEITMTLNGKPITGSPYSDVYYLTEGWHEVKIKAVSLNGCVIEDELKFDIQSVTAGVTKESRTFYCTGPRQFKDSSLVIPQNTPQPLKYFFWDLGTGSYSSHERDPIKEFQASKYINIRHRVSTSYGCWDTISFQIRNLKTQPRYGIKDPTGCAPYTVELINATVGTGHFIWEVEDSVNFTTETYDKNAFVHTFKTPGLYHIRLIGIDSAYDPVNDKMEYCYSMYPEFGQEQDILVLPSTHPGILGPDSVCVGSVITLESQCGKGYTSVNWILPDGGHANRGTQQPYQTRMNKRGVYTYSIIPIFFDQQVVPQCISSITKTVTVMDAGADFWPDPNNKPTIYRFVNNSSPRNSQFTWDFGHPESGDKNISHELNGKHNYGASSGTFDVCLSMVSPLGCKDTFCRPIDIEYFFDLNKYNVFTPGNYDGLNDEFEITIDGEEWFRVVITNRWGEKVFEQSSDIPNDDPVHWNGKMFNTGRNCPAGTYYYVIHYKQMDGIIREKVSGVVTLIR
jgi:PKD repeat protein